MERESACLLLTSMDAGEIILDQVLVIISWGNGLFYENTIRLNQGRLSSRLLNFITTLIHSDRVTHIRVDGLVHQWSSYQIRKIAGCACAGNVGNVFPATAGWRSRHAPCITARASRTCRDACRDRWPAVSFEVSGGKNLPGITGACVTRNFTYLVRGAWFRLWPVRGQTIFILPSMTDIQLSCSKKTGGSEDRFLLIFLTGVDHCLSVIINPSMIAFRENWVSVVVESRKCTAINYYCYKRLNRRHLWKA